MENKSTSIQIRRFNGFTLIDTLSSIAILSIIIITFFSYYMWLNSYLISFSKSSSNYTDTRLFVESFQRDIGNADWVQSNEDYTQIRMMKKDSILAVYLFDSSEIILDKNGASIGFGVKGDILPLESKLWNEKLNCLELICVDLEVDESNNSIFFRKIMDTKTKRTLYSLSDYENF